MPYVLLRDPNFIGPKLHDNSYSVELKLPWCSVLKIPLAYLETQIWILSWEDPLIRKWLPTPIFLPGKSQGQRSLVGYDPWGPKKVRHSFSQFSHSVVSDSLQPHGLQHARLSCPLPTPGACSNSCPLSRCCHPTISSLSPSPPSCNISQHQGLFQWVSFWHQVAKVLEFQLHHQSFQWIFRTDFL